MKKINKLLFKDVRLLYVEDDPMTMEEISYFLRKYVKELYLAKNGEEGIEAFKKYNPDMIITDIQMPIMNGLEMCEEIFKIKPDIPVAVTTAYSEGDYLIKAIELGIEKYLLKPVNLLEMLAIIQKSLSLEDNTKLESDCDDYIQFILDSNPAFMFILHSDKLEYANKSFLELMGHDNISSLKDSAEQCKNLVSFKNKEVCENWMDYIINSSEEKHLVSLNNINKEFTNNSFYVTHKYFKSTNKSVFAFVDTNVDKLNKINDLAKKILESSENNKVFIEELEEIINLSSKEIRF